MGRNWSVDYMGWKLKEMPMGGFRVVRNSEVGMRNAECGLRPVGAIGAYAPEGSRNELNAEVGNIMLIEFNGLIKFVE